MSTMVLVPVTVAVPFVPCIGVVGFVSVPASLLAAIAGVAALHVLAASS